MRANRWIKTSIGWMLGLLLAAGPCGAISLNEAGTMNLTGKIETRNTFRIEDSDPYRWPKVEAGDMVEQRNTLQLEFDHDMGQLGDSSFEFKYHLVGRAYYDGIFDYGPDVWRNVRDTNPQIRDDIDDQKTDVELREGYFDLSSGPFFLRIGRQNLAWGETDAKRLLDAINPLDNTRPFLKLDDRRIPLWMARSTYNLGSFGFLSSLNIEGFISPCLGRSDDRVGPTTAAGSPYAVTENQPTGVLLDTTIPYFKSRSVPDSDLSDARWGVRVGGILGDNLGFTLAHYRTYVTTAYPVLRRMLKKTFSNSSNQDAYAALISSAAGVPSAASAAVKAALAGADMSSILGAASAQFNYLGSLAIFPEYWLQDAVYEPLYITGGSFNFWQQDLDVVFRGELAYFQDEPFFDPDVNFNMNLASGDVIGILSEDGTLPESDVIRFAFGLDKLFWIRPLNSSTRFTAVAQYFGAYIKDYRDTFVFPVTNPDTGNYDSIKRYEQTFTFKLSTTYLSGTLEPEIAVQYDPRGNWAIQPACEYEWDMWRFKVEGTLGTANCMVDTGAVRDKDEVSFTISYLFR